MRTERRAEEGKTSLDAVKRYCAFDYDSASDKVRAAELTDVGALHQLDVKGVAQTPARLLSALGKTAQTLLHEVCVLFVQCALDESVPDTTGVGLHRRCQRPTAKRASALLFLRATAT